MVSFSCLTSFCLLPDLSYFHFKLYFPPFNTLFLFLILTISPPSILSKSLFFPLYQLTFLIPFLQYPYFPSTFINRCLFGVETAVIAVFPQFYSYLFTTF